MRSPTPLTVRAKKAGQPMAEQGRRKDGDHHAVFETAEPVGFPARNHAGIYLETNQGRQHTLGRFPAFSHDAHAQRPIKADPLTAELRPGDQSAGGKTHGGTEARAVQHLPEFRFQLRRANKKISKIMDDWPTADTTMVLSARKEPRVTHIFNRGDFSQAPGRSAARRAGVSAAPAEERAA